MKPAVLAHEPVVLSPPPRLDPGAVAAVLRDSQERPIEFVEGYAVEADGE